jgi:TPR repeat protein
MYENGEGTPEDYAEAVRWYKLSAEQDHAPAQHALGFMYQNGKGIRQDLAEARWWYSLAADQGHEDAQTRVELMDKSDQDDLQDEPDSFVQEGVLARCGASSGYSYFFGDPAYKPSGSSWEEDGMSQGNILLVRLGDEWDIQFGDSIGAYGYRQDGASVLPLGQTETMLTVGVFGNTYVDLYTFNSTNKEVAWTSHKIGTDINKVAIFRADCSSIAAIFE